MAEGWLNFFLQVAVDWAFGAAPSLAGLCILQAGSLRPDPHAQPVTLLPISLK